MAGAAAVAAAAVAGESVPAQPDSEDKQTQLCRATPQISPLAPLIICALANFIAPIINAKPGSIATSGGLLTRSGPSIPAHQA